MLDRELRILLFNSIFTSVGCIFLLLSATLNTYFSISPSSLEGYRSILQCLTGLDPSEGEQLPSIVRSSLRPCNKPTYAAYVSWRPFRQRLSPAPPPFHLPEERIFSSPVLAAPLQGLLPFRGLPPLRPPLRRTTRRRRLLVGP